MRNKILNRFIGVYDDRDEYQLYEIHKELAFSGIMLWYLTTLLMIISLIIDTIHHTLSFATPSLFIVNMIYAILTLIKIRKKQLDETDCASIEEYEEKKKQLKKSSFLAGIQWGLSMLILMEYVFPYLSTGELNLEWWNVLIWLLGGMLFGMTMYLFSKSKLQKHF
ncbi:DUF3278 domain-containing protein [Bacillus circulans]|jgi:hypothetical protein|uniref:DUF3278 domain-containing protein n=2 Tax=Niallia circulans TaxID=1397 RepID=A0AA91YYW4_NIACI|nr:DUF3278 domain-containing protein [Niallia circulans]AYV70165.1 DUF3278 domain-containing protein [Niallia circulans]NRG28601.1 DUF3278 domain-containing protein [Niallia circulans]PAD80736.1 hypothetical protein CHH57_23620 [Niallia circulans]QJX62863.1 DUF3278 domain-containing protein [Niallia circulans]UQZ76969.1 DUF3278 domain-containing protein [Niallia circulans]